MDVDDIKPEDVIFALIIQGKLKLSDALKYYKKEITFQELKKTNKKRSGGYTTMKSQEERNTLINQVTDTIYRWKHVDDLNSLFFDEFIKEDVSRMEVDQDDKTVILEALDKLFNLVIKYEKRGLSEV